MGDRAAGDLRADVTASVPGAGGVACPRLVMQCALLTTGGDRIWRGDDLSDA